ncbi:MAG: glycosyltransferase [Planctomycetota bacterium]|nr:glycosyltransferase [Planctomycetota bacterium]
MSSLYPALADPNGLPKRVLVFAPHADDEVFGCGGMQAFHAERGDTVRVVIVTDGAGGDPAGLEADIARTRQDESRRAGAALGVTDYRFLDFPDGGLASAHGLVEALLQQLDEAPGEGELLCYAPSLQEMHADHRALAHATLAAVASFHARGGVLRLLLFGINAHVQANLLFDTSATFAKKRRAVECFESQLAYHDLVAKTEATDRARTVNIEDSSIYQVEGFLELRPSRTEDYRAAMSLLMGEVFPSAAVADAEDAFAATAVISVWNRIEELRANLDGLRAQLLPFAEVVVVDNASSDGTPEMVADEYPEVRLIRMPNSDYGACETFNIGFASVTTPLLAILDDDVVLPPDWLQKCVERLAAEPDSTAVISTKVVEPEMPESYKNSESVNSERYMSTFRGCGSLARTAALREVGWYDEYLFIYGNERDLTCRLLNAGYRVLQFPGAVTFHRQPFGVQMGKRSLYFHARNAWITMLKYAPLGDLVRMPWLVLTRVLLRGKEAEAGGEVTDATGTIGIGSAVRETPGALWILVKASFGVLAALGHVRRNRAPVSSKDFDLPLS